MGYLGAILGPFWAFLGLLYLYFTSRRSQSGFKKTCVSSRRNASFWDPPTLAVSGATFGASLGPSWAILKPPWSHLGPYWAHLGPILGLPGAIPAALRKICWSKFCVTQNLPQQKLHKLHQDTPREAQDRHKMGPRWPKMASRLPKTAPDGPRKARGGPKMALPSLFGTHVEAQEAPLEALLGPRWGSKLRSLRLHNCAFR